MPKTGSLMSQLKKNWQYIILLAISVIMLSFNFTTLVHKTLVPVSKGDKSATVDFYVYYRTVQYYFDKPVKIYYTPPEDGTGWYLYPPVSVFLFLPFGLFSLSNGAILFFLASLLAYLASVILIMKLAELYTNKKLNGLTKAGIIIFALSIAPLFQNLRNIQVNTIVLFLSVLFITLLLKRRAFLAAFILSISIWLKLYPVLLLPMLIKENKKETLLGLAAGLIGLPILLLIFMPVDVYRYYFFEQLPKLYTYPITVAPMNQSITSFIMMFYVPVEKLAVWGVGLVTPLPVRLINLIVTVVSVTGLSVLSINGSLEKKFFAYASILSITTITSVTGWEHTYVMSMPLLVYSVINAWNRNNLVRSLTAICIVMFFIPKPPDALLLKLSDSIPGFIQILFYVRFVLSAFALMIINYFVMKNYGPVECLDEKHAEAAETLVA